MFNCKVIFYVWYFYVKCILDDVCWINWNFGFCIFNKIVFFRGKIKFFVGIRCLFSFDFLL